MPPRAPCEMMLATSSDDACRSAHVRGKRTQSERAKRTQAVQHKPWPCELDARQYNATLSTGAWQCASKQHTATRDYCASQCRTCGSGSV
eukprot:1698780-Rhodomonas_salina.4